MSIEAFYKRRLRESLSQHFDANETLFLEREVTQLRAKIFEVQFPELKARRFAPKATDIAASADTYAFKVLKPVGKADLISYKSTDIPRVDIEAAEVLGKVYPIGASFGWDINELRESVRLNVPLSQLKARVARESIERSIDFVLAFGAPPDATGAYPTTGMNGLINNPYVTSQGITPGLFWDIAGTPKAADLILKDLSTAISEIRQESSDTFNANTLILPPAHYDYIQQTPFSTFTGKSILSVLLENNPGLMVDRWHFLTTAGAGGGPRALVYQNDPTILEAVVPQEFEVMPPEVKGFEFLNNCHARCGGVKVYQPSAMRYVDFATS
ncbi:MAG TPA: major capsid family protein [Labilithrix sp.]|jgi:hypothetical protein|nr:major capsid family protein [Labilithrix sp.]